MKTNELMIGDWVQYLGKYFRVKAIDGNDIYIEDSNGAIEYQHIRSLEPIPMLIEYTLGKIGFTEGDDCFYMRFKEGDSQVIITYDFLRLDIKKTNRLSVVSVPCMYVHELQHALRLCRINKEIEL